MITNRRTTALAALCAAVTTAGLLSAVPVIPAAAAGEATALAVGARPNATRLEFRAGDAIEASVDVGTGNLLVMSTDLTLPGIDRDLQLGLAYNSLLVGSSNPAADSPAGVGWQLRIGEDTDLVANADGSVLYLAPGGLQGLYQPARATGYTTPAGFKNTLVKTSSGWELTDHASNGVSTFNASGRLTEVRNRNGQATTFSYGGNGHLATVTSTRGGAGARTATYSFGYAGELTKLSQTGNSGTTRTVAYTVDDVGVPLLTSITDTLGRSTSFGYDASNRLTSITNTAGVTTRFEYNVLNKVTRVTQDDPTAPDDGDPVTRIVYVSDTQTRVAGPNTDLAVAVGAGPHTAYTLDVTDRVISVKDPLGRTRAATYTPTQDVASVTAGTGGQTSFGYGANGGESLTEVTSPTGASTSAAYANTGASVFLPSSTTDAQGNTSSYTYDGAGNQVSTSQDALAATSEVTYHADGVLATAKDPRGHVTTYTRDPSTHQITGVTPPSGSGLGATTLTWDEFGRVKNVTDGRGTTTTYAYDAADRVTGITYCSLD